MEPQQRIDMTRHTYKARIVWEGNTGVGTAGYTSYERSYRLLVDGKPDLVGSSDPSFRGDAGKHNPEDLFLASISACHMLFFLSLCARRGIKVVAYEDEPVAAMQVDENGGGRFEEVMLRPTATLDGNVDAALADELHERAHELCFIANSCSIPIRHEVTTRTL